MIKHNTEIRFGAGTVRVGECVTNNGDGVLICRTCEPHKIGSEIIDDEPFNPEDYDVKMFFSNTESVDVMINKLCELRYWMKKYELETKR